MRIEKLKGMVHAEVAADKWWDGLSDKEKKAYVKAHPRSKYADKHAEEQFDAERRAAFKDHHAKLSKVATYKGKRKAYYGPGELSHTYHMDAPDEATHQKNVDRIAKMFSKTHGGKFPHTARRNGRYLFPVGTGYTVSPQASQVPGARASRTIYMGHDPEKKRTVIRVDAPASYATK